MKFRYHIFWDHFMPGICKKASVGFIVRGNLHNISDPDEACDI